MKVQYNLLKDLTRILTAIKCYKGFTNYLVIVAGMGYEREDEDSIKN